MESVYKSVLLLDTVTVVMMNKDSELLSVGFQQKNVVNLWYEINTDTEVVERKFRIYGTGYSHAYGRKKFVGTAQEMGYHCVCHVYELLG